MKKILICLIGLMFAVPAFAGDLKPGGMQDGDMYDLFTNLKNSVMNGCYADGGLGMDAASSANIETTATISYTIDGVWYSKVASGSISVSGKYNGTPASQNVSTYAKYLVCVNAAGNFSIIKGNEHAIAANALLPALPSGYAAIGYFQILTSSTVTYKPGTTRLDATGVTDTYVDLRALNSGSGKVGLTGL